MTSGCWLYSNWSWEAYQIGRLLGRLRRVRRPVPVAPRPEVLPPPVLPTALPACREPSAAPPRIEPYL
jgi:hypothetical protein